MITSNFTYYELEQRVAAGEQKAKIAREFQISRETLYQYCRDS